MKNLKIVATLSSALFLSGTAMATYWAQLDNVKLPISPINKKNIEKSSDKPQETNQSIKKNIPLSATVILFKRQACLDFMNKFTGTNDYAFKWNNDNNPHIGYFENNQMMMPGCGQIGLPIDTDKQKPHADFVQVISKTTGDRSKDILSLLSEKLTKDVADKSIAIDKIDLKPFAEACTFYDLKIFKNNQIKDKLIETAGLYTPDFPIVISRNDKKLSEYEQRIKEILRRAVAKGCFDLTSGSYSTDKTYEQVMSAGGVDDSGLATGMQSFVEEVTTTSWTTAGTTSWNTAGTTSGTTSGSSGQTTSWTTSGSTSGSTSGVTSGTTSSTGTSSWTTSGTTSYTTSGTTTGTTSTSGTTTGTSAWTTSGTTSGSTSGITSGTTSGTGTSSWTTAGSTAYLTSGTTVGTTSGTSGQTTSWTTSGTTQGTVSGITSGTTSTSNTTSGITTGTTSTSATSTGTTVGTTATTSTTAGTTVGTTATTSTTAGTTTSTTTGTTSGTTGTVVIPTTAGTTSGTTTGTSAGTTTATTAGTTTKTTTGTTGEPTDPGAPPGDGDPDARPCIFNTKGQYLCGIFDSSLVQNTNIKIYAPQRGFIYNLPNPAGEYHKRAWNGSGPKDLSMPCGGDQMCNKIYTSWFNYSQLRETWLNQKLNNPILSVDQLWLYPQGDYNSSIWDRDYLDNIYRPSVTSSQQSSANKNFNDSSLPWAPSDN